ncbi:MAG: N-acetylneuraminate synthase family protein [Phormidesmis sp. FL-bin-119]|nr:N-acetylneuraminate synthase family protein [Pedobacter sp.]
MKTIDIDGFNVGGCKSYIIADIGSNHKQDLVLAKETIDAAAESGANAVKFQSIQLGALYHRPNEKTSKFIRRLEFPEEWYTILKEYCDKRKITFFSSPTYLKSVDLLEEVNVSLYKLASAQIGTFPQIIHKVAALDKPTIFSTGISTYADVITAVEIFKKYNNHKFIILHCNSIYPTPAERVNLPLIQTYTSMFGNPVGFSDHTIGTHIACAAVALGAKVVEKHFTMNRNLDTPDCSAFASDPSEFATLVKNIRDIEAASLSAGGRMEIQFEETEFKNTLTYRLVARVNIEKGDILVEDKLEYLRSADGVDCKNVDLVLGKYASENIRKGEIINYEQIR